MKEIVDLAKPLEGLVRQDSIHAAGVVIGDRAAHRLPAAAAEGRRTPEVVTQFPMGTSRRSAC